MDRSIYQSPNAKTMPLPATRTKFIHCKKENVFSCDAFFEIPLKYAFGEYIYHKENDRDKCETLWKRMNEQGIRTKS